MKHHAGVLVAIALALGLAHMPASADTLSDADRAAIQSLIGNQIDAFRHDDGTTAYADASPTIHSLFPTADAFMAMVKSGYQPVYRPQSVTFGQIVDSDIGPLQKVYVTGPDGKSYIAVYSMERESDGTWKINGCSLTDDDSPSI